MDKLIFYTMVASIVIFGAVIYRRSQMDSEPVWSKHYVEPPKPMLLTNLRHSEAWLLLLAASLAFFITGK